MNVLIRRLLFVSALLVRDGRCQQQQQQQPQQQQQQQQPQQAASLRGGHHDDPSAPILLEQRLLQLAEDGGIDVAGIFANATAGGQPVAFPANSSEAKALQKALKMLDDAETPTSGAGNDTAAEGDMPGIIGGERSDPNEYSYFVQAEGSVCGATLVAKDVVMTAAHCRGMFSSVPPRPPSTVYVAGL
jgi:Trypsin